METLATEGAWSPSPGDESPAFSLPAPSSVSRWSEMDSSAGLAAQKLLESLGQKEKTIEVERKKAEEARRKCEALLSQLTAKTRNTAEESSPPTADPPIREEPVVVSDSPSSEGTPSKSSTASSAKRKSPCTDSEESDGRAAGAVGESDATPVKKKRTKRATPSMVDILPEAATSSSDDDVPAPDEIDLATPVAKQPEELFRKLESIVTSYKLGEVNPKDPKSPLGFTACAELCEEEMRDLNTWSKQRKSELHPIVVSAIRVVFPDKKPEWYHKAFIKSPIGAADYWYKVLERRAQL